MTRDSTLSRTGLILAASAAAAASLTIYNVYRARKVEHEHPPTGRFVTINGIRIHYLDRGEGPPVVLLHGNLVTAEDFELSGVLNLVAKRHRVVAFDRPGFGYSERPRGSAWTAAAQADLMRDAFAALGLERPIVLGHSWGAVVALALATNHVDAVSGLVLLSGYYHPTLRADVLLSLPGAIPGIGDVLDYTVSPLIGTAMLPLFVKAMFAPLPVAERFARGFSRGLSVRPQQLRAESQDGTNLVPAVRAMRHRYSELALPVVIMGGIKDRVVDVGRHAIWLHREIPHSTLRLVPEVGHMLHYAVPEQVAEAIETANAQATTPASKYSSAA
jgi:pimeloyl-ACP methyl ester carboxylesterase